MERLSGEAGYVVDDWRKVCRTPEIYLRQTLPVGMHNTLDACISHMHNNKDAPV